MGKSIGRVDPPVCWRGEQRGAGSLTTVVDSSLAGFGDEYFRSATLLIVSGGNAGMVKKVFSYTSLTGTFVVTPSFPANVATGDKFMVLRERWGDENYIKHYVGFQKGAGSTTVITDIDLAGYGTDYFRNCTLAVVSGANVGRFSHVENYVSATGAFTVHTVFPANVATGDKFVVYRELMATVSELHVHNTEIWLPDNISTPLVDQTGVGINAWGNWYEILAATTDIYADFHRYLVVNATVDATYAMQLGVGAALAEVPITEVRFRWDGLGGFAPSSPSDVMCLKIPTGTRVACRMKKSAGIAVGDVSVFFGYHIY